MGGGGIGAVVNPIGTAVKKVAGKKAGIVASPTGALAEAAAGSIMPQEPILPDAAGIPELPRAPKASDPEVQAAKKKERKAARLRQGRSSTILSNLRQQFSPGRGAGGAQLG